MSSINNYNIVVVGSGISSFFFLKGLNKKYYHNTCVLEGNKKIKQKLYQMIKK